MTKYLVVNLDGQEIKIPENYDKLLITLWEKRGGTASWCDLRRVYPDLDKGQIARMITRLRIIINEYTSSPGYTIFPINSCFNNGGYSLSLRWE